MKRPAEDRALPSDGFPSRRTATILLIGLTLLSTAGLAVAVLLASVAPLVFDAPGAADDPRAWATCLGLCVSPLPFVGGILGAWVSFALKRYRLALGLMALPLLGAGLIGLCVLFGEGF